MNILEPDKLASQFRDAIKQERETNNFNITIVGFLASGDKASEAYAHYTRIGCEDVGINFELIQADPASIKDLLLAANADRSIHGIFVYYPIFGDTQDLELRQSVAWHKDVEGLTPYWLNKLYANQRFDDAVQNRKAILPCTPLAIIKILETTDIYKIYPTPSPLPLTGEGDLRTPPPCHLPLTGEGGEIESSLSCQGEGRGGVFNLPFNGRTITIFNRSEVVGKPLAYMLSHDGSLVYSFDIHGGVVISPDTDTTIPISREQALFESDVVITGVPIRNFHKISAQELRPSTICLNFSHFQNFTEDAKKQARCYIPRVGTLTVAMCLRNAVRLYRNYHQNNTYIDFQINNFQKYLL